MQNDFFSSDIIVTNIDGVVSEESRTDMNYFFNRSHHALIYKVSGTMVCYYRDKTVEFSKNDIVYIPKGMTYRSQSKSAGRYILINFDTAGDYPADNIFVARFENHSNLHSLFSKCAEEWVFKDSAHLFGCRSYIYKILALMARALDGSDMQIRRLLEPSLEYLRRNINKPNLGIPEVAAASGLNEVQFRRYFKQIYIVAPSRYIISVRIGQAKELLKLSKNAAHGMSTSDIADAVGFSDTDSFVRLFKREVGMPPMQWRDSEPD